MLIVSAQHYTYTGMLAPLPAGPGLSVVLGRHTFGQENKEEHSDYKILTLLFTLTLVPVAVPGIPHPRPVQTNVTSELFKYNGWDTVTLYSVLMMYNCTLAMGTSCIYM